MTGRTVLLSSSLSALCTLYPALTWPLTSPSRRAASKEEADKLFQDVLRRKDRADSTRSALAVLQRYRFLFYLPVNIERNMRRREFDVIINDYAKARGLFADTEVQVRMAGERSREEG